MELVLRYLLPVNFMHTIEASKSLYKNNQSEIQEKRKESLVKFTDYDRVKDFYHTEIFRCTKLPNSNTEGKCEVINRSYYTTQEYINGLPLGNMYVYDYLRYEDKYIPEKDREVFRKNPAHRFGTWKSIDVSRMTLIAKYKILILARRNK